MIATRSTKRGVIEIYPKFIIGKSSDLMIRGGDFYAIWLDDKKLWSTDEQDALRLIDHELDEYAKANKSKFDSGVKVMHMWDAESGMIDSWHKYCQRQMRDNFHMLDEKLVFSNTETTKQDYASKRLPYPLENGPCPAWDEMMSVLYSPEERDKIEWAIGSIVQGDSKQLQKFMVLYGASGTGKSTVLNVIQQLFEGYYTTFQAKNLGASTNAFALEPFRNNPLVAIEHDGDLSRIEDNTLLNSLVSHEEMTVNEKFKSTYSNRFKCFLFMGTNKPVRITDAKSGLIRRLIDVSPSGNKLDPPRYRRVIKQVSFELGAIANHCMEAYLDDPERYDDYIPVTMLGASNDFYNFICDSFPIFNRDNQVSLASAWELYKTYCDDAKVAFPYSRRAFQEELKNYFDEYKTRYVLPDGTRIRSYYIGFKTDKFCETKDEKTQPGPQNWIEFKEQKSLLDDMFASCKAQYANDKGTPAKKWDEVTTTLADLDTSKLHYVLPPEKHIFIDFDIPDEQGNKSFERNLEEAGKWPKTYAELSKSGCGIHLHYIYSGDASQLASVYADHIEIKVCTGKSSLRRKLSKCNDVPIATLSSGLPLKKEVRKTIDFNSVQSENGLRDLIARNLRREIHKNTKPSVDFIYKILEDAYNSGLKYDVTDMRNAVFAFAASSNHQAEYCMRLANKMQFKSNDISEGVQNDESPLVFYDVEVFPNLFLVNWKVAGEGKPVVRMINPTPEEIEELLRFRLVGFNCRRYDNHILYGRFAQRYDNRELYLLSQRIVSGDKNAFFGNAYNISYTDVYDFSSKKQSLKKFEIELGIHHQELGLPWDEPVPEELWDKVAEYCDNDVIACEAVFNARQADFTARKILADVAGMTVNDTTNSLTTRIIFGKEKNPQKVFNYRDMGKPPAEDESRYYANESYTFFTSDGKPIFPDYKYEFGKSTYRGETVGEGGYVYAEPGMYWNVALLDIASMHPSSIVAEELFGKEYTRRFQDILEARIAIKHKDFEHAKTMLGGKLAPYLTDEESASALAGALKIAINSVYGLTSAGFENPFRDIRNKDNIVAKRGALFMVNLKHEVQERGFTVAHIKTDSIKIPNATPEIIRFVVEYGKLYGYNFEHEATYDRMCLVNDAVYIAKYATVERCNDLYGADYVGSSKDMVKDCKKHPGQWTATGTQFQVPYVFKTLFSKEPLVFGDKCETKSVSTALYLDLNEGLENVSKQEAEYDKLWKQINDPKRMRDSMEWECARIEELTSEIAKGHNYVFIGKVGLFCPVKPGCGGGELLRKGEDKDGNVKYSSVAGAKGYRWMEAETVKALGVEDNIDISYYDRLVTDAISTINQYGDFEQFAAD